MLLSDIHLILLATRKLFLWHPPQWASSLHKGSCIPGAGVESALPYFNVILKFDDSKVRDIIWVTSENIDHMGCSFDPWGPQLIVAQADTKSLMILSHTVPPAVNSPNPHTTLQAEIFSNQNTKNMELQTCIKTRCAQLCAISLHATVSYSIPFPKFLLSFAHSLATNGKHYLLLNGYPHHSPKREETGIKSNLFWQGCVILKWRYCPISKKILTIKASSMNSWHLTKSSVQYSSFLVGNSLYKDLNENSKS